MIALQELTRALAEQLTAATGVPAFAGRAESAVYPCLLVEAEERQTVALAGGRQIQREAAFTVTCLPSRQRGREEGLALADAVQQAVLCGFTAGGRGFCPQKLENRADGRERRQVCFTLGFCDVPQTPLRPRPECDTMGRLHLTVRHRKEEL